MAWVDVGKEKRNGKRWKCAGIPSVSTTRELLQRAFDACNLINNCDECPDVEFCVSWFSNNLDRHPSKFTSGSAGQVADRLRRRK